MSREKKSLDFLAQKLNRLKQFPNTNQFPYFWPSPTNLINFQFGEPKRFDNPQHPFKQYFLPKIGQKESIKTMQCGRDQKAIGK
jgi:hypothetical protein